jgi:quinoprotein glucose dehydrogenase
VVLITLTSLLFTAIGATLVTGGVELLRLGGSAYYLLAGFVFLFVAILVFCRRGSALPVYGLFILGSLAWAIGEVGLDWWQLAPRGGLTVLLGIWLLTPWMNRQLERRQGQTRRRGWSWSLSIPVLLASGVGVYAMVQDTNDLPGNLPPLTQAMPRAANIDIPAGEWREYGRTQSGQRYSPLTQITPQNVGQLQEVWRYRTGDRKLPDESGEGTYQATPLKIGNTLYLCTPHNQAIALDATSGAEKWRFDATKELHSARQRQTCRGVTYFDDTAAAPQTFCKRRIYLPISVGQLVALDAENGERCNDFARQGVLDLVAGMPYAGSGFYYVTSPPLIVADKIIIGGAVSDSAGMKAPSGVIRAFDVRSGALLWNWDSGNPDKTEPLSPGETYTPNSPNSWSLFSADAALGLVYIPLGNQVPDELGTDRNPNVEKVSSSIVALDIESGRLRWVRQTVHHDLWDMDVPAQPVLLDLTHTDGVSVPALVGATKQGDIYVLDRRTGEPLLPIEEVPAPSGAVKEDFTAATQPLSKLTFMPQPLRERDMWGLTLLDQLSCRIEFLKLKYAGRYTPPSVQGSIVYPGNFGVFNWGSIAVDPERQVMFGMPTYLAFISRLVPQEDMPAKGEKNRASRGLLRNNGAPYGVRLGPFLGPLEIPCQAPPWGYVAAADLRSGEIVYRHVNGTIYDTTLLPLPFKLGVPGLGGPILTKGGVGFLAATIDDYLRAYDLESGRELWRGRLPAGGQATPLTYLSDDARQFVVIVAGGHGLIGTTPGDYVIAYALPKRKE